MEITEEETNDLIWEIMDRLKKGDYMDDNIISDLKDKSLSSIIKLSIKEVKE